MSIELPFEKVQHFRSRLEYREEDTSILRAKLGDKAIYIARSFEGVSNAHGYRPSGELVLKEWGESREIVDITLPHNREMDPIARERALTLLAYTALQEIPDKKEWDDETLLFGIPTEKEPFNDPEYRKVLGLRKRGTGRLAGGRPEMFMTQVRLSSALGNAQEALERVQSYSAPFPAEAELPRAVEWTDNERTA